MTFFMVFLACVCGCIVAFILLVLLSAMIVDSREDIKKRLSEIEDRLDEQLRELIEREDALRKRSKGLGNDWDGWKENIHRNQP